MAIAVVGNACFLLCCRPYTLYAYIPSEALTTAATDTFLVLSLQASIISDAATLLPGSLLPQLSVLPGGAPSRHPQMLTDHNHRLNSRTSETCDATRALKLCDVRVISFVLGVCPASEALCLT